MNETLQIVRNVAGAEEEEASYNFFFKISFKCFDGLPAKTSRLGPDQLLSEVLRDRRQIDVQFEFEEREREDWQVLRRGKKESKTNRKWSLPPVFKGFFYGSISIPYHRPSFDVIINEFI